MFLILLTFITALSISGVAIYYSILGLAAIFAAAAVPIMIMGTVLEVGKLVTASWLYQNWRIIPWLLKSYLTIAVVVLMFITSMGIFGFLSKAHVEQTSAETNVGSQIETIDEKILRSENKINRWLKEIDTQMSQGGANVEVRVDELVQVEQGNLNDLFTRIAEEKKTVNDQTSLVLQNLQAQLQSIYDRIANENKDFLKQLETTKQSIKDSAGAQIQLLKDTADNQIALQNDRREQASARKDEDMAQTNLMRDKRQINKKTYNAKIEEILANEVAVASAVQKEIIAINEKLQADIEAVNQQMKQDLEAVVTTNDVDAKYQTQIDQIQSQIVTEQESLDTKLTAIDNKYQPQIDLINTSIEKLRTQSTDKTEDIDARIEELEALIDEEQKEIDIQNEEKIIIMTKLAKLEADVGPLKYIAEFVYGQEADTNLLEKAVRWVIIIIIFVFDPLAVLLLIAANFSLKHRYGWDFESFGNQSTSTDTLGNTSKKKDSEVIYKDRIVKIEEKLNVEAPHDVVKLEQQLEKRLEEKNNG